MSNPPQSRLSLLFSFLHRHRSRVQLFLWFLVALYFLYFLFPEEAEWSPPAVVNVTPARRNRQPSNVPSPLVEPRRKSRKFSEAPLPARRERRKDKISSPVKENQESSRKNRKRRAAAVVVPAPPRIVEVLKAPRPGRLFDPYVFRNADNPYDSVLQYHLLPDHETLDSRPFPRPPTYFSIDLSGKVPEFRALYPPPAPLWLSVYATRYDYHSGFFYMTSMIHCIPSNVRPFRPSACRVSNLKSKGAFHGVLMSIDHVRPEMFWLSTGLRCNFYESEEALKAGISIGHSRIRVKPNPPSHYEFLCDYPLFPRLPHNNSRIAITFHGKQRKGRTTPLTADNQPDFLKAERSLKGITRSRIRIIEGKRDGFMAYPELFRLVLNITATYDRRYTVVQCSNAMRTNNYLNTVNQFVNYHLYAGIEHFAIFDRTGLYKEALEKHINTGSVSYLHVPVDHSWRWPNNYDQTLHAQTCKYRFYYSAKHLAYIDVDEFFSFPAIPAPYHFPNTCLKARRHRLYLSRPMISLRDSLTRFPIMDDQLYEVPVEGILRHYEKFLFSPCRSLISDFLFVQSFLKTYRYVHHARYISLPVSVMVNRSPEFWKAFLKRRGRDLSYQSSMFSFPIVKSFTFSSGWSMLKSIVEAASPCIPDIHVPTDCFEERSRLGALSTGERVAMYRAHPRVNSETAVLLHYQNIVAHDQGDHPDIPDRAVDESREIFNQNPHFFEDLLSKDQERFLNKGQGRGVLLSGVIMQEKMEEFVKSGGSFPETPPPRPPPALQLEPAEPEVEPLEVLLPPEDEPPIPMVPKGDFPPIPMIPSDAPETPPEPPTIAPDQPTISEQPSEQTQITPDQPILAPQPSEPEVVSDPLGNNLSNANDDEKENSPQPLG